MRKLLKHFFRIFAIFLSSFIISNFTDSLSIDIANTFFTISGIFFSIGISQIMSFDLRDITDEKIYSYIIKNNERVRRSFFLYFLLSGICITFLYVFEKSEIEIPKILCTKFFNIKVILVVTIIFVVIIFLLNFLTLASNKDKLDEQIRKEQIENKAIKGKNN